MTVRDIEIATHNCFEYVYLKLFILENTRKSRSNEIAKLTRQIHVVNNLRAKFLMSMNILEFEQIILNIFRRKMILSTCDNLKIDIQMISNQESRRINRIILIEKLIIVSIRSVVSISIKMKESISDRDYFFQSVSRELNLDRTNDVMIHMMNVNLAAV
jgi:hypothetical protein